MKAGATFLVVLLQPTPKLRFEEQIVYSSAAVFSYCILRAMIASRELVLEKYKTSANSLPRKALLIPDRLLHTTFVELHQQDR